MKMSLYSFIYNILLIIIEKKYIKCVLWKNEGPKAKTNIDYILVMKIFIIISFTNMWIFG